jgi:hypothetical protein
MHLNLRVKTQIKKSLTTIFPIWSSQELVDNKRVFIPQGPGTYTMDIQKHRGLTASTTFMMLMWKHADALVLKKTIQDHQPELMGQLFIPGQSWSLNDIGQLIACWCNYISTELRGAKFNPSIIDKLLLDVESVLTKKTVQREIFSPIDGVRFSGQKNQIDFGNGLKLRKLTDDEKSDLLSEDILFSTGRGNTFRHVESVIVQTGTIPVDIRLIEENQLPQTPKFNHEETYRGVRNAVASIHILKSGHLRLIESRHRFRPNIFPHFDGYATTNSFMRETFGYIDLDDDDLEKLAKIYQGYSSNQNDQLKISIGRLSDAENRISNVDVLLDSIIGLEVLLNPMDNAELSFRVALNYAFLGAPPERKKRYYLLKAIQAVRNRIVHGGLNTTSKDADLIHSNATLCKECLREVVMNFLMDENLQIKKKLDAEFWIERIL